MIKKLEDYRPEEIEKFDSMHLVLKAYNNSLNTKNELPLPSYSDEEMSAYSIYRELLLDKLCGD